LPEPAAGRDGGYGQEARADSRAVWPPVPAPRPAFRYCLNTATIRGQKLGSSRKSEWLLKQAMTPSNRGWMPWRLCQEWWKPAGFEKRISDSGLTVESAIGFTEWIVDDEARRAKGLERPNSKWIWWRRSVAGDSPCLPWRYGFAQAGLAEGGGAIPGLVGGGRAARGGTQLELWDSRRTWAA